MDFVQETNCGNVLDDAYSEKLLSLESTDVCDDYRDPELLPRIGDEYQVEIPPLIAECYSSIDAETSCGLPSEVLVGLPVSIMWIKGEVEDIELEPVVGHGDSTDVSECITVTQNYSDGHDLKPKVEPTDIALDREIDWRESSKLASQSEIKIKMHQKNRGNGYRLVPGFAGDAWSDNDEASFLLGLYIFGKNLVQVKKFVESKRMGEILSFYYGKFYRSDKYHRWSKCRKMRRRKCIYGERIFTGLRQQELLSRLLPLVSEESQNTLLEDSKAFGEGKLSLEEYVLNLRDKVGLNALVEAVGVGKGKQDLTGMAVEPLNHNKGVTVRPEVPTGKACMMLTPLEIINLLTGGYRLSKARSNDLFWEAVWPRLLARGWQSEEPKNYGCASGSKHSLVFLVPGVKKFSRRKLVKGDHYFDSVSDVLRKVAAEPGLLELEVGKDDRDTSMEENGWTDETKLDQQDFPDQQRCSYLKPRTPNRGVDGMKFTVVDTSLANGGTLKVRELRSLPVQMRTTSGRCSEDTDGETSEDSTDESDSSDTMCSQRNEKNGLKPRNIIAPFDRNINKSFPVIVSGLTSAPSVNISGQKSNIGNSMRPRKRIKAQLNHRLKPDNGIYLGPVTKQCWRFNSCNRTQTNSTVNSLVGSKFKQDEARCCVGNLYFGENISFQVDHSQEKFCSSNSTSKGSPVVSGEGTIGSTCSGVEHPNEEPPPRRMIDLNLPVSPEAETDEAFVKEETERQPDQVSRLPDDSRAMKDTANVATSVEKPEVNARRHSTRNRPLTTKALEALAFGFLSTKQRRKFGDSFPGETSRHSRVRTRVTKNLDGGIPAEEKGNDLHNDNGNMFSDLQV